MNTGVPSTSDKAAAEGLKAFADAMRQIITLSTGIIALTVTFLEKVIQPNAGGAPRAVPWPMLWAWIIFGITILLGLWTLLTIAGSLNALDRKQNGLPLDPAQADAVAGLVMSSHIRLPAILTILAFVAGVGFTIGTGFALR